MPKTAPKTAPKPKNPQPKKPPSGAETKRRKHAGELPAADLAEIVGGGPRGLEIQFTETPGQFAETPGRLDRTPQLYSMPFGSASMEQVEAVRDLVVTIMADRLAHRSHDPGIADRLRRLDESLLRTMRMWRFVPCSADFGSEKYVDRPPKPSGAGPSHDLAHAICGLLDVLFGDLDCPDGPVGVLLIEVRERFEDLPIVLDRWFFHANRVGRIRYETVDALRQRVATWIAKASAWFESGGWADLARPGDEIHAEGTEVANELVLSRGTFDAAWAFAKDPRATGEKEKPPPKPHGRPPVPLVFPGEDRMTKAWASKAFPTYEACARELGVTAQDVKRAVDRKWHRDNKP